jgi:signal transduction histidine kinase
VRIVRSLRGQLTLLYSGAFIALGLALIGVPLLQTSQSQPVAGQTGPRGVGPPEAEVAARQDLLVTSAVGLVVTVLVAVALGWLIAGRLLRPLRTITATARDISASNLHRRLGAQGHDDEFRQLTQVLDDLFARLEASFQAQRRFVANASHELRTPLTAERTLLQVTLADPDATAEDLRAACREVLTLGDQQARLIDALLALASSESGVERQEPFDVAAIVDAVVRARTEEAKRRGLRVEAHLTSAPAAGDPNLVESLVANLVDNALRHNVSDGWVRVTTETGDGRTRLIVRNTGPVIPESDLDRLLEPFQQLAGARVQHGGGHGLGLAIVRTIAEAHRAELSVRARPEGGLDVTVTF